tara:strand:+ start:704 stop:937 length:234 start_codon:yes stop_codon:yes gene_type:complete
MKEPKAKVPGEVGEEEVLRDQDLEYRGELLWMTYTVPCLKNGVNLKGMGLITDKGQGDFIEKRNKTQSLGKWSGSSI